MVVSMEAGGRPMGNGSEEGCLAVVGSDRWFVEVWYTWLVLAGGAVEPENHQSSLAMGKLTTAVEVDGVMALELGEVKPVARGTRG
jgi:hypothetical protein